MTITVKGGLTMQDEYKHRELTDAIICCFYTVYNTLGFGFLEKVYENALLAEFQKRDITATIGCRVRLPSW